MSPASAATLSDMVGEVGYALRLPKDLKAQLEVWAKRERRSLNSLIVVVLERAVAEEARRDQ